MSVQQSDDQAVATAPAKPEKKPRSAKQRPKALPPYHVVLLDDEDHTYEYVMEMLRSLFGYPPEQGFRIADEVNNRHKAIVCTTHKERAELKRDQIHAFGTDVRVPTCAGSMSAVIIPAEA
jgi:ATP-dependent Clp protease adaptor protein ClpS